MHTSSLSHIPTQTDEALRLLAGMYARRFQWVPPDQPIPQTRWHACERIRDLLYQARDQPYALAQLEELAEQVEEEHTHSAAEVEAWRAYVGEASDLVAQVIQAGGDASVLIAGETDGFRHLCLRCCQDESNFERVRFFTRSARRPLLKAEVNQASRSLYGRCQICHQVLAPEKWVVLVPAGTTRHEKDCACLECSRAGLAWLLNLYARDEASHALLLPRAAQIAAPSLKQARTRAFSYCWQHGWYVLFDQPPC
jgi:hypothetical protein